MSLRNWDCTEQDRIADLLFLCVQKYCHIAENEKLHLFPDNSVQYFVEICSLYPILLLQLYLYL